MSFSMKGLFLTQRVVITEVLLAQTAGGQAERVSQSLRSLGDKETGCETRKKGLVGAPSRVLPQRPTTVCGGQAMVLCKTMPSRQVAG